MAEIIDIRVPDIGGAENVEVVEILVQTGDTIALEQELIAIETDKATMEIPAPSAGILTALNIEVGSKISEGEIIGKLEVISDTAEASNASANDEASASAPVETPAEPPIEPTVAAPIESETKAEPQPVESTSAASIVDIHVPDIGGAENVEVVEILVQVGDSIEPEQELIAIETDKSTMEIPAPSAGILKALSIDVGSKISQGDVIGQLQVAGNTQEAVATSSEQTPQAAAERGTVVPIQSAIREEKPAAATAVEKDADFGRVPHASPSVRKLARELDVPLSKVTATGVKGRITRDDVFLYVKQVMKQQANADSQSTSAGGGMPGVLPWPKVDFEKFGEVERKALPRIRKISGANLHRNWVTIPHVTNHEDADISDLEAFRQQLNKELSREGKKVTLLAFMVKACVAALKQFPEFNSSLDGEELVLKNYYHIGFAADTPNGLVVPVIRDADKKGIIEIAEDIQSLSSCARDGKLSAADMSGGCFSISSLGGIGGTYFTPIINAPEVAILGVAKAKTQLVWNGEAAEPRLILPMSLSWDHRVVDGAQAGKFNAYLSAVLSDFRRISL